MNKRIRKKVAKREAELGEAQAQASAPTPGSLRAVVRSIAERIEQQPQTGALGLARAVAEEVQARTTEAIGQVKEQIKERVTEKVAEAKQKLVSQEEQAEAALEKVPLVGAKAAKKLHELTHD